MAVCGCRWCGTDRPVVRDQLQRSIMKWRRVRQKVVADGASDPLFVIRLLHPRMCRNNVILPVTSLYIFRIEYPETHTHTHNHPYIYEYTFSRFIRDRHKDTKRILYARRWAHSHRSGSEVCGVSHTLRLHINSVY